MALLVSQKLLVVEIPLLPCTWYILAVDWHPLLVTSLVPSQNITLLNTPVLQDSLPVPALPAQNNPETLRRSRQESRIVELAVSELEVLFATQENSGKFLRSLVVGPGLKAETKSRMKRAWSRTLTNGLKTPARVADMHSWQRSLWEYVPTIGCNTPREEKN